MTDRIQLSSHTWLSDGYLYTTSHGVAAAWTGHREVTADGWYGWVSEYDIADPCGGADTWRIPVSTLPEVYGYRENEPFVWVTEFVYVGHEAERDMDIDAPMLHLRAVIPCDGSADSLRALWNVIKKVRNDHGE